MATEARAVLLNGAVILIFYYVRASLPILSLAIADVLLAVSNDAPLGIAANVSRRWIFGSAGCNWCVFAHTVVGLSSILHHADVALGRCMRQSLSWLDDDLVMLLVVCQLSRDVIGCEDC